MKKIAYEVNFDGIVGPTHNYSGLSFGNTASESSQYSQSNPREAALQGLEKMKFLADKGFLQGVLPPQERPFLPALRKIGFTGTDHQVLTFAHHYSPTLFLAVCSSACMWTANAATVSPSADSMNGSLHFTTANLSNKFHRSIEAEFTASILKRIFKNTNYFTHHDPLPGGTFFSDEGAANHLRFCKTHAETGIQMFIYGRAAFQNNLQTPKRYPARQTKEASEAIARLHKLPPERVLFVQQNPEAIDAGAFHNDVVSVGNENVFFFHEKAFVNQRAVKKMLQKQIPALCHTPAILLEVKEKDVSLQEAISSYLFNSQLLSLPNGNMILAAPLECQENPKISAYIKNLIASTDNPIQQVYFFNLRQSMQNGGGPACLRLKVVLTQEELQATHQTVFLNDDLYHKLKNWIQKHYRDRLDIKDLADPNLLDEGFRALDALTEILKLPSLYTFQA